MNSGHDSRDRGIALGLMQEGRLSEAQLEAALQVVAERRAAGAPGSLLDVLVERGVLDQDEAEQRVMTLSSAAESIPDDPFAPAAPQPAEAASPPASPPTAPQPPPAATAPSAAPVSSEAPLIASPRSAVRGDPRVDARDRGIALGLMQEARINEAQLQAAVQTVLQRRAAGTESSLLALLVERGVLDDDEAEERVMTISSAAESVPDDPFAEPIVDTDETARLPQTPGPAGSGTRGSASSRRTSSGKPRASSRRRMSSSGRHAATSSRRLKVDKAKGKRTVVFAVSALCFAGIVTGLALIPRDPETAVQEADPLASLEVTSGLEALRAGNGFLRARRCAEGVAFLDDLDPAVLKGFEAEVKELRDLLARGAALLERLAALEAQGPGSRAYQEAVVEVHQRRIDADLLPLTPPFLERAQQAFGSAYDELVLFGLGELDEEEEEDVDEDDDFLLVAPVQNREIVRRGSAERRATFRREGAKAEQRLLAEIERLEAERAEHATRTAERAKRALADDRPLVVPAWRGAQAVRGALEAWDREGFTVRSDRLLRFSWTEAPPALAYEAFRRGLSDDDLDGHFELGWRAARGGLLEQAGEAFAAVQVLDPERAVPDLAPLRPLSRLLHGAGVAAVGTLCQSYTGTQPDEGEDWSGLFMEHTADDAGLSFDVNYHRRQRSVLVRHTAPLETGCRLIARGVETGGQLYIELDGTYLAVGRGGKTRALNSFQVHREARGVYERAEDPVLSTLPSGLSFGDLWEGRVGAASEPEPYGEVMAYVERTGNLAHVTISIDGREVGAHDVTLEEGPIFFGVGTTLGPVTFGELVVLGVPDASWVQQTKDAIPFRLERELQRWRVEQQPNAVSDPVSLPTSADDEAGLEGISRDSIDALRAARHALREGRPAWAERELDEVNSGNAEFWAASYVRAVSLLEQHGHGESLDEPRLLLDRSLQGMEDFYEAMVARADLALLEGDHDAAQRLSHQALRLRPDYGPAHLSLAWQAVHAGRFDEAAARAELGARLHPAPKLQEQAAQIQALRAGPAWNRSVSRESEHYLLRTDLVEEADTFVEELERVRRLAPRVLPCLTPRADAAVRKGTVFVFSRAEDFYRYYYSTAGTRGEYAAGVFNPRSRQLMLFDSQRGEDRTLAVLRHEATHQWVHSMGLALPYWTNEALADYMAGVREVRPGEFETQDWDLKQLGYLLENEAYWEGLFDLMTLSPEGFYSGDVYLHYAQAFSFVQYCMEGGYPGLREAFFSYLQAHGKDQGTGIAGIKLDHLYAETFHQLDMQDVESKWRKHTIATGISLGVGR